MTMDTKRVVTVVLLCGSAMPLSAAPFIDPAADTVLLRKSCTVQTAAGPNELDNCFTRLGQITAWMATVRKPNATKPLRVDMGPGSWGQQIAMTCEPENGYTGYTSFMGSGPHQTIISPGASPVQARNCTHLNFSNFKIETAYHWPEWSGGGESRWSDMELILLGGAWDEPQCGATRGKHYWYSSKLAFGASQPGRGYVARCDESWFFGSEIKLTKDVGNFGTHGAALLAEGDGEIHVYGGNIGAIHSPMNANTYYSPMIGASNGGKIHIHGTGIDMVPYGDRDVVVLEADSGGMIHAHGSAYAFDFSSGVAIARIVNNGGAVMAPYAWGGMTGPVHITSITGADTYVEMNCNGSVCNGTGSEPHTMLYDSACGVFAGGPWRDTQTGSCRSISAP